MLHVFFLLSALHDYLMSVNTLSFVSKGIGIGDLMLCAVSCSHNICYHTAAMQPFHINVLTIFNCTDKIIIQMCM